MLDPKKYIDTLTRSDVFLENRSQGLESSTALGATALQYVDIQRNRSEYLDSDALAVQLLGRIESFKDSQKLLDKHEDGERYLSKNELRAAKMNVVLYNHAIRDIIDANPDLTANKITDFVGAAQLLTNGPADSNFVTQCTRKIIFGMQHEIFVEQALWNIDGLDIIETDAEDDLKGIDIKFKYKGQTYLIDVKASKTGEDRARTRNSNYSNATIPFWSGLHTDEVGNKLRASQEQVDTIRDRVLNVVLEQDLAIAK